MSAGSVEGLKLDRAKAVREMDREDCDKQDDDHRYRRERNKRPEDDEESADDFDNDGHPTEQRRGWNADGVQYADEMLRATGGLRKAGLHEAKSHNQPERNGIPRRPSGQRGRLQAGWHGLVSSSNHLLHA